jgi:redox-sensitive bicupin YhaK (pirin superfamily)
MHRDSLGTKQRITPGAVNLMTAGSGIVHTERTPEDLRQGQTFNVHGFQIWIALPKEREEMNPEFHHIPASALPNWEDEACSFTLIAGAGFGHESPVPFYSPGFLVEVDAKQDTTLRTAGELSGEIGICVVNGGITACENEQIRAGNMVVSKTRDVCSVEVEAGSKLLLFGGEPLPEERFIDWNFVSSSKDRIKLARADWKAKNFTFIPGDDSYVPLPSLKV